MSKIAYTTNSPITVGDRQTDIFAKLQTAVGASRGLLTWADVSWGINQALNRKKQDALHGLLSGWTGEDLQLAERVAYREMEHATAKASMPAIEVISADQSDSRTAQKQKAVAPKPKRNR